MIKKINFKKHIDIIIVVTFITILLIIRFFFGTLLVVSGPSMIPTFNDKDYAFCTVVYDNTKLNDGDIVVVRYDNRYIVKRLRAMPGETVGLTEEDIIRNVPILTMGEDEYYVLGDNYEVSNDSRAIGPISRSDIVYKYTGMRWTPLMLFLTVLLPLILLMVSVITVFIPENKKTTEKISIVNDINSAPNNKTQDETVKESTNSQLFKDFMKIK